jgi:GNAT superfamily N-acetyltransferase
MVPTDSLAIAPIGAEAIAQGSALTAEVGWNQTADDWAFFLAHGTVFGAREHDDRLAATAATLPYAAGFAWISLVIVSRAQRGHGLGTRLLNECVRLLRARGTVGMLDATPAGERVYAPLGFRPLFGLNRWIGSGGGSWNREPGVRSFAGSRIAEIAAVDAAAFGSRREALLADFLERAGTRGFQLEDGSGYAIVRRGRVAAHLGPVVAGDESGALALIEAAVAATAGPLMLDVPHAWSGTAAWLKGRGFAIQRPFLRMALGREAPYGEPARLFAIAGPEYG